MFRRITKLWQSYDIVGRFFWSITFTISCYGMSIFCYYTSSRYYSEPVSMTVDTNYVPWNLSFPAVSICLIRGKGQTPLQRYMKSLNISYNESFLRNIHRCMFANANQIDLSMARCDDLRHKYDIDLDNLKRMFLPDDCNVFVENLTYSGKPYDDCSSIFKFHQTELGYCFIANSIMDYDLSLKKLKLHYTFTTSNRRLSMRLRAFKLWLYTFYVHGPEDIPFFNSVSKEIFTTDVLFSYVVRIISTDLAAAEQPIQDRGCRFPHEVLQGSPFHYSFSTCMSFLRIQLELEECNCTFITSPEAYRPYYCNSTGIKCLSLGDISNKARNLAVENSVCLPSCTEQIVTFAGQSEISNKKNSNYTDVSIEVAHFPPMRYVRTVTRTKMDLAVSVAGIAGLFFGVSVLNFMEAIYFLMIRRDIK